MTQDVIDALSIAMPAIGALFVGMVLSRKLAALDRDAAAYDRKFADLTTPALRRPTYRPRWRFPFRMLRSASLWIIFVVLASRRCVQCMPDPQPVSAVMDPAPPSQEDNTSLWLWRRSPHR